MSNFGYDYPIFNWQNTSDPLGTILDCTDHLGEQILEWDLTNDPSEHLSFQQLIEMIPIIQPSPSLALLSSSLDPNALKPLPIISIPFSPFDQPMLPSPQSPSHSPSFTNIHPENMETEEDQGGFYEEHSSEENESIEKELSKVKLQASKSPIMDALVYCALNRWGIELLEDNGDNIRFRVLNFQNYYKYSGMICAKQNPTEDIASRIKALKRWFPDFPTKRAGNLDESFEITVQLPNKQDNKPQKLHEIIEKQRRVLGVHKITRQG